MASAGRHNVKAPEQRLLAAIKPACSYWQEHADMRGSVLAIRSLLADLLPNDKYLNILLFEAYKPFADIWSSEDIGCLPENADDVLKNLGFSESEIRAVCLFWGTVAGLFKLDDVQDFFADLAAGLKEAEDLFIYGFPVDSFGTVKNERLSLQAGDIFLFGTEPCGEKLRWRVLSTDFVTALICAEQSVGRGPFHNSKSSCTWDISFLRCWLNTDFLQTCFTPEERRRITVVPVPNSGNRKYNVSGGSVTRDKVYLLSDDEADLYFESDAARVFYENYGDSSANPARYWLRTPGQSDNCSAFVNSSGTICLYGFLNTNPLPVRPVMRIRL
ncbi:MAG: DUF6273 domain-containing protein [bacterium]|nr:DUF6273 domain-containing protein [bacterium]